MDIENASISMMAQLSYIGSLGLGMVVQ